MEAAENLTQLGSLKEENDSLKCQLEAYINEAEMVKLESKKHAEELEKQIKSLQNALKGMQQVCGVCSLYLSSIWVNASLWQCLGKFYWMF